MSADSLWEVFDAAPLLAGGHAGRVKFEAHLVFGEDAEGWLNTPNALLDNRAPENMLTTVDGVVAVWALLQAVKDGLIL